MTTKIPHGVYMARWHIDIDRIRSFYKRKPRPKTLPRLLNKFGLENFELKGDTLYYKNREILVDDKRRAELIDAESKNYGGIRVIYYRLRKKYIGISFRYVQQYLNESERRQLKQRTISAKSQRSFIHAPRPGSLQMDLTFYRGHKLVVFGLVDVFSRWCYYELVKSKKAQDVAPALKNAITAFKKIAPHQSIYVVASDNGSEFKAATKDFLEKYKEDPKKFPRWRLRIIRQKQPQRLIEALNGTLRKYVERVTFRSGMDLRILIRKFVKSYNDSRHSALGTRTPNEVLALTDKAEIKKEATRQFDKKKAKVSTSGWKLRKLTVGSLVRISLRGDKDKMGHAGTEPNWSKTIYRVHRILKSKRGKDRYVVHTERTNNKHGIYFRDKLLAVSIPRRLERSNAPVKKREAKPDDAPPAPVWKKPQEEEKPKPKPPPPQPKKPAAPPPQPKKPPAPPPQPKKPAPPQKKDDIDLDLSSSDDVDLDLVASSDEDEKQPARPKKPPKPVLRRSGRKRRRVVKKRPLSDWYGRTVYIEGERGVVLEIYKKFFIIFFAKKNSIYPAKLNELDRTDWQRSRMSDKWLDDKKHAFNKAIVKAKAEVDEES